MARSALFPISELCCSVYCLYRLCCFVYEYCLCVNVYCTTATGCNPIAVKYISYHIMSYHIISYHIISYHIISYHIISYHIISYIISYRIISYHFYSVGEDSRVPNGKPILWTIVVLRNKYSINSPHFVESDG